MFVLKLFSRAFAAVVALALAYLAAALLLGAFPVNRDFQPTPGGIEVFVCSNGVHTDFVLPVKTAEVDWSAIFLPRHYPVDVTGFDHVGIGWGNLDFYRSTPRWSDFRIGTALHAVLGFGAAAFHVQYRPAPGPAERCGRVAVSPVQYRALANYIAAAMAGPEPSAPGYGTTDLFYPARGHFSLFESCNVWVGQGLQAAGLPTGLWTPFAFQVLSHF